MKNYLAPILIGVLSFNAFAQTSAGLVSDGRSVDAVQQGRHQAAKSYLSDELMLHLMKMMVSISKVDEDTLIRQRTIRTDEVKDLSEQETVPEEMAILKKLAVLVDADKLESSIRAALVQLSTNERIQKMNPELAPLKTMSEDKKEYLVKALVNSISAVVGIRGMSRVSPHENYQEWTKVSAAIQKTIESSTSDNILEFAQTDWTTAGEVRQLINGPTSFQLRDSLMASATKTIDVLTWSIYDDVTGAAATDLFLKKQAAGIKVRIIVDGQVAQTPGQSTNVKKLEDAGIEIIRWRKKDHPFFGQHRKMIVVDDQHVVAGGMNFGDVYSHKNPATSHWRDTDFYFNGAAAVEAKNFFATLWNEQVERNSLKFPKAELAAKVVNGNEAYRVALINHDPSAPRATGSTIMLTLLKAIRQAKQSIDIENAYIVLFPALKNELALAVGRNVKVRLLTNSPDSVDEPIVSLPILRSARMMVAEKAEVYLKKGDTLHSKFAIVDNHYSMILSYNLHPRSERVEGEMAVLIDSQEIASKLTTVFEDDISTPKATYLNDANDLKWKDSPASLPTLRIFFDLL